MTEHSFDGDMSSTATPPTLGGALGKVQRQPVWHTVLGIISIVFGAGAVIGYGCMAPLGPLLMKYMGTAMEKAAANQPGLNPTAAQFRAVDQYMGLALVSNMGLALLGALLLAGGIGLMRRRRWAVGFCQTWAVLKIIYALPQAIVTYLMQSAQMEAMTEATSSANTPMPNMGGFLQAVTIFAVVLAVLWAWAYPVFVLIWFRRRKIRAQVAAWSAGGDGDGSAPAARPA